MLFGVRRMIVGDLTTTKLTSALFGVLTSTKSETFARLFANNFPEPILGVAVRRNFSTTNVLRNDFENHPGTLDEQSNQREHGTSLRQIFSHDLLAKSGHRMFVIQPKLKQGSLAKDHASIRRMMDEVKALVESLPNWSVAEEMVVNVNGRSTMTKRMINLNTLESLIQKLGCSTHVTAVFVNVAMLTSVQYADLELTLKLPIYDRYTLILEIFRTYAHTKEAKLQIAMAELQYLRVRHGKLNNWKSDGMVLGSSYDDSYRLLMQEKEIELKRLLEDVQQHKQTQRNKKSRENLPVISVVGYTNSGKTSIIRCLTQDTRLVPENRLFATLAVSVHAGRLPSNVRVLYADSIGFISDLPSQLVAGFVQMLEDVRHSQLLIHVRDMSHPDRIAQKETVITTLRSLQVSETLMKSMIEVWNKMDNVNIQELEEQPPQGAILTSCKDGLGLDQLLLTLEKKILTETDMRIARLLVPNGGPQYRFLETEGAIVKADPTSNASHLVVTVIMRQHLFDKFLKAFGNLLYNVQSATPESKRRN